MPYTIIVGDDNSLYGSCKIKIMQREKLFNKIWFLVPQYYNGYDMSQCRVTMRYMLPVSREFVTETLVLSDEKYQECLKYVLPIDTKFSKEGGDIELNLTFTMLDVDNNGNIVQRVRKTDNHILHITQLPNWDSVIPDSSLAELDQRILKIDAQIRAIDEMNQIVADSKADNIKYNYAENSIQLLSGNKEIGNKVTLKSADAELEDGIPVVNFNDASDGVDTPEEDNNVVEFDDYMRSYEEDNVAEF